MQSAGASMVRCPQCDVPMHQVMAPADPGTLIQLDQCRNCGGIWCDKWELFPVDPDAARLLDPLDEALLNAPAARRAAPRHCPRCTAPLQECKDPGLPSDLLFDRCLRCEGIWLNRHELARYKEHQRSARVKNLGRAAMAQKIPQVYADPRAWVVKGTQGMMAYPRRADDSIADAKPDARDIAAIILQTLVRAVLGV
jgi:Zn-finger nucleic acid-binding protein